MSATSIPSQTRQPFLWLVIGLFVVYSMIGVAHLWAAVQESNSTIIAPGATSSESPSANWISQGELMNSPDYGKTGS